MQKLYKVSNLTAVTFMFLINDGGGLIIDWKVTKEWNYSLFITYVWGVNACSMWSRPSLEYTLGKQRAYLVHC
jgi:hypothetical protein